jgi:hypothetical protein
MDRGHPVRQRARRAQLYLSPVQRMFALRAQADRMSAIRNRLNRRSLAALIFEKLVFVLTL